MDWGDKITPSFGFSPRGVNAVCGQALLAVYNRAYSHRFILYIEHFHLLLWHCSHLKVSPAEQSTDCRGWSCFPSSAGRQLRRQTDTWKPQICLSHVSYTITIRFRSYSHYRYESCDGGVVMYMNVYRWFCSSTVTGTDSSFETQGQRPEHCAQGRSCPSKHMFNVVKGIFRCKFNPWSKSPWYCVRLPLKRSS